MKKILSGVAIALIILLGMIWIDSKLSAPAPNNATSETEEAAPLPPLANELSTAIAEKTPALADVTYKDGVYSLTATYHTSDDIASFGNYVLDIHNIFIDLLPDSEQGSFELLCFIHSGTENVDAITFNSLYYIAGNDELRGIITDSRSGSVEAKTINSKEDLFTLFPAAKLYAAEE